MVAAASLESWLAEASVAADVFELRPDYVAGVMAVEGLQPGPSDAASGAILSAAEARAGAILGERSPEELDHVAEWRQAYRAFGAKPQRTRPSVETLLRRLAAGLPRLDRITDLYNAVSVAHVLPVGGEDRAAYLGCARLVRATGAEPFDTMEAGTPTTEHPAPGEVVWVDDAGVTCRRWNWRQCVRTRITRSTASALFIFDALGSFATQGLGAAMEELGTHIAEVHVGATISSRVIAAPADRGAGASGLT